LCTNNDDIVTRYNTEIDGIPQTDICDDMAKESADILRQKSIRITYGEYVLKSTIGSVDQSKDSFDKWDEAAKRGCCTIS
jgi:hypothetical protein